MNDNNIIKILFTGGSGAGKTSTIELVREHFENEGYDVFIVNEIPTMLLNNGFNSRKCGRLNFLELIAKIELYLSNLLVEQAKNSNNEKKMILFDKCPIDNIAFIEKDELTNMFKKLNTSFDEIINSYDLILHLETIAKSYPELYTNDNNKNRTLDKDLAIARNNRLLEVYGQNPKCIVIEGYKDIKEKQEKVIKAIESILI